MPLTATALAAVHGNHNRTGRYTTRLLLTPTRNAASAHRSVAPPGLRYPRLCIDTLVCCAGCTAWRNTAALKEAGRGDDAGVRGLTCDGGGHVDRLIT
jgi:hypothetical protein